MGQDLPPSSQMGWKWRHFAWLHCYSWPRTGVQDPPQCSKLIYTQTSSQDIQLCMISLLLKVLTCEAAVVRQWGKYSQLSTCIRRMAWDGVALDIIPECQLKKFTVFYFMHLDFCTSMYNCEGRLKIAPNPCSRWSFSLSQLQASFPVFLCKMFLFTL